jgi:hypothetical protein
MEQLSGGGFWAFFGAILAQNADWADLSRKKDEGPG